MREVNSKILGFENAHSAAAENREINARCEMKRMRAAASRGSQAQ